MKLSIKDKAPNFSLPDQKNKKHTLSDYRGTWVLLYFYPKDDTPGCTKEACEMRDNFSAFEKSNAMVFGVSADSAERHAAFAKKYELDFFLLSDQDKKIIKLYGAWAKKKFMGREYMGIKRMSFLIDPKGVIRKIYDPVKPGLHAEEALADIKLFSTQT